MESDSFSLYSLVKLSINCMLIILIATSLIAGILTGVLWVNILFEEGTFNILYLISCVLFRLISGWLIKVKDKITNKKHL